jgi:hypothetical protein
MRVQERTRVRKYVTLSAVWLFYYKKKTIGKTDNHVYTTLVNSASTALPIGLPPKGAKFCHTSNILLVGIDAAVPYRRYILIPLRSVGQLVGWSVGQLVGWLVSQLVFWSVVSPWLVGP